MRGSLRYIVLFLMLFSLRAATPLAFAQSMDSGTIFGTVVDSSGAVIPDAQITVSNAVSGLTRNSTANGNGAFTIHNLPFGSYSVTARSKGFGVNQHTVDLISAVPVTLRFAMKPGAANQTVTVRGHAPLSTDTSLRTSLDRDVFNKIPLESSSSELSSLVTMTAPGVAADSDGLFHGLGDHDSNSFSVDGEPITDQQAKIFSNQLPVAAVQSIQIISGAPPAQYGDKTSLVIKITTRSGEGVSAPTGSVTTSYGSFGTAIGGFNISYGQKNWGNFFEIDGQNSGRFLDTPEFSVMHDKGNEQNVFDRIDYQFDPRDSMHLDLNYSRSWFQTPNTYDNLNVENVISGASPNPVLANVGDTDQRSKIGTFNISPTYTRLLSNHAVLNFGVHARRDAYNYYPSNDPLADLGPANLQQQSVGQQRSLLNTGVHSDLTWTHGVNTVLIGGDYNQTFLREHFQLGIVNNLYNAPCIDADGNPVYGHSSPGDCPAADSANPAYDSNLAPYDLTRGGTPYHYFGHTDVKELGTYAEDEIKTGPWFFNFGLRGDVYNGLSDASQAEPRISMAYTIRRTGTVLRASYARTLETPFNENLVLSSEGCANPVLNPLLACSSSFTTPLIPGKRNEFHAGLEQNFGRHVSFSGDYIWKYTHDAYDFSVLGNTPITFPIEWHNSKIPGFAGRIDVINFHNFLAYTVFSSVAARFFPPQAAGAGATVGQTGLPFRIDHDEHFNDTTHMQYSLPFKTSPWIGFNWRYDSGLVAGAVPCYNPLSHDPNSACADTSTTLNSEPAVDLSSLTADQEFEAGLICDGVKATPGHPLPSVCPADDLSSSLVSIPAPGTGDNDLNPPRIKPHSTFDLSLGDGNLFTHGQYRWSLVLTGVNIANKYALYNFLSTFSGTHYVTPRALTAEVGFHF